MHFDSFKINLQSEHVYGVPEVTGGICRSHASDTAEVSDVLTCFRTPKMNLNRLSSYHLFINNTEETEQKKQSRFLLKKCYQKQT